MKSLFRKAHLYYHTLRHLKFRQLFGRLWAEFKRRRGLFSLPEPPSLLTGRLAPKAGFPHHCPWNTSEGLREGRFTFLNVTRALGQWPDWHPEGMPLLWLFNLHYFKYLHLLKPEEQEELCLHWISNNPVGEGVGWHPYPLSLRVASWCKAQPTDPAINKSIYQQAQYLYRNTEFFHPGNHYLENAKALVFAGAFLAGQGEADQWLQKGLKILQKEIPDQVLEDGGYFERSTTYHALMLELLTDVLNIIEEDSEAWHLIETSVQKMADFLLSLTHPDGTITLFNDSTEEIAPSTASLLRYVSEVTGYAAQHKTSFPDSGYFVMRSEHFYLAIDAGPLGPDYLLAHAHADLFTYELSVNGERTIVDTGVFEYPAGELRSLCRSTTAHNCPTVDDVDQAECWSSFRVARRFKPCSVRFLTEDSETVLSCRFDGYSQLIGDNLSVTREVRMGCDRQIVVTDTFEGEGAHRLATRIHLHPSIVVQRDGKSRVRLPGKVSLTGSAPLQVGEAPFFPRFGMSRSRSVITLREERTLPAVLTYTIDLH